MKARYPRKAPPPDGIAVVGLIFGVVLVLALALIFGAIVGAVLDPSALPTYPR